MRKRMKSVLIGILALAMLGTTGCSRQSAEDKLKIYVICKSTDPYWDTTKAGALEAGEEMQLDVIYEAPESEGDIDVQIQMVNDAIADGADAIVLAPLDTDLLNEALRNATSQNIPILTIDSDVSYSGRSACISTQNASAGAIAARQAASLMDEAGEIGIISHKMDSQTAIERAGGFQDEINDAAAAFPSEEPVQKSAGANAGPGEMPEGIPDDMVAESIPPSGGYPDIDIVEIKDCEGNIEKSKEGAKALIAEHPNLKLIYATNQPGTVGVCQAIEEMGKADEISVVGFDWFSGAEVYVNSGVLDGCIAQNPYNMGYLGVRYARKLIQGEQVAAAVDTGATLITRSNITDADVQWLISAGE